MSPETMDSSGLAPCPERWNCVVSREDALPRHRIEPFRVAGAPEAAFDRLRGLLESWPRTTVVEAGSGLLRAECRSRLGFTDDLEFRWDPARSVIHVRSASRVGMWDLGVNRRRVEALRGRFQEPRSSPEPR